MRPSTSHGAPSPSQDTAHLPQAGYKMGDCTSSHGERSLGVFHSFRSPSGSAHAREWGVGHVPPTPSPARGGGSGAAKIGKGLGCSQLLQQPPHQAMAHSAPRWPESDAHPAPATHAGRPTHARSLADRRGAVCVNFLTLNPLFTFRQP